MSEKPRTIPSVEFTVSKPHRLPDSPADLNLAWQTLGLAGKPTLRFEKRVLQSLRYYPEQVLFLERTPASARQQRYERIKKHSQQLVRELENLPDDLEIEIIDYFFVNYPDYDFENFIGTDYEGLHVFEADILKMKEAFERLNASIDGVQAERVRIKGRPKTNGALEKAIQGLQAVYEEFTERTAREGFTVSAYDADRPYQGRFMDFLTVVLWGHVEKEHPSVSSIGEAARNALGLRKR